MDYLLQILHFCLFAWIAYDHVDHRRPSAVLAASGVFYLMFELFLVEHLKPYPFGIFIYVIKISIDGCVAAYMNKKFTDFSLNQMFILWLIIGLNILAIAEFPFDSYIIYNNYANISYLLNIMQLIVGSSYVVNLSGVCNSLATFFYSLDANTNKATVHKRIEEK